MVSILITYSCGGILHPQGNISAKRLEGQGFLVPAPYLSLNDLKRCASSCAQSMTCPLRERRTPFMSTTSAR